MPRRIDLLLVRGDDDHRVEYPLIAIHRRDKRTSDEQFQGENPYSGQSAEYRVRIEAVPDDIQARMTEYRLNDLWSGINYRRILSVGETDDGKFVDILVQTT